MPNQQPAGSARDEWRRSPEHRRRRFRRHRRRAFIRSIYSLPSLATLGNAICGFAAIYVAGLSGSHDRLGEWFSHPEHRFVAAAVFIFLSMVFDALDGRLARFTRHTTDFGGQLDSLADMISFGAAPAFLAIQYFKTHINSEDVPLWVGRAIWAFGAMYLSCAAIRLARFNVSNQHGEQHHFSFLGLPSPGAAGAVAVLVLLHEHLDVPGGGLWLAHAVLWAIPVVTLMCGLLMVSTVRYTHMVNRYLRGKKSVPVVLTVLAGALLLVIWPLYAVALGMLGYAFSGLVHHIYQRLRRRKVGAILGPHRGSAGEAQPAQPLPDGARNP